MNVAAACRGPVEEEAEDCNSYHVFAPATRDCFKVCGVLQGIGLQLHGGDRARRRDGSKLLQECGIVACRSTRWIDAEGVGEASPRRGRIASQDSKDREVILNERLQMWIPHSLAQAFVEPAGLVPFALFG